MTAPRDTQEIRERMLRLWEKVEARQISASEARLHIALARVILETLKVEIAAAHLNQAQIPSVPVLPPYRGRERRIS